MPNLTFSRDQADRDISTLVTIYGALPNDWIYELDNNGNLVWYNEVDEREEVPGTFNRPLPTWYSKDSFEKEGLEGLNITGTRGGSLMLKGSCNCCCTSWFELGIKTVGRKLAHDCMLIDIASRVGGWKFGTGIGKRGKYVDGLILVLRSLLSFVSPGEDQLWSSVSLCTSRTLKIHSVLYDIGFGCTYKCFQMLLSSLINLDCYDYLLSSRYLIECLPTITEIQKILYQAVQEGFIVSGSNGVNYQELEGSRRWIGIHECYTMMSFLGIRAIIQTFESTDTSSAYEHLLYWSRCYFSSSQRSRDFIITTKEPVYLQWEGHCVVLVGIGEKISSTGEISSVLFCFDSNRYTRAHLVDAALLAVSGESDFFHPGLSRRKDLIHSFELDHKLLIPQKKLSVLFVDTTRGPLTQEEREASKN